MTLPGGSESAECSLLKVCAIFSLCFMWLFFVLFLLILMGFTCGCASVEISFSSARFRDVITQEDFPLCVREMESFFPSLDLSRLKQRIWLSDSDAEAKSLGPARIPLHMAADPQPNIAYPLIAL